MTPLTPLEGVYVWVLLTGRVVMWVGLLAGLCNVRLLWTLRRIVPGLGVITLGLLVLDATFVTLDFMTPPPILKGAAARYAAARSILAGIQVAWTVIFWRTLRRPVFLSARVTTSVRSILPAMKNAPPRNASRSA
jgi:hypothetical protein